MEPTDGAIISRCQKGDKDAFGIIVTRYMKRAYYAALAITGDPDEAMDLSQEAFVRTFRGIKRFDTSMQFFPWYYRTLKNLWINRGRRTRRVKFHSLSPKEDDDRPMDVESSDDGPVVEAEKSEMSEALLEEMAGLPSEKREILHLRHFENLSYKEIAETLQIPEGTVMSRLYAARAALRVRMEKYL